MNTNQKSYTGIVSIMLSAIIFGFTPILAKLTYQGGSNGIMATFLRAFLALPILYMILRIKKIPMGLTRKQCWELVLAGGLGTGLTTVLLYISYDYINVGLSTPLHFIYPLLIVICYHVFFHEKMKRMTWYALFLGLFGLLCLIEPGTSASITGISLSLLSGVTYSIYIISLDRTSLKEIHFFKLSFYLCIMTAIVAFIAGVCLKKLTLSLTPQAWFFSLLVSFFTSIVSLSLFQIGILLAGAASASMLSTLEPITGIILGILILKENSSVLKVIGSACIIASVFLVVKSKKQ